MEYMGQPLNLGDDAVRRALDPASCVEARQLTGGPAPARVREDIARARQLAARDEAGLGEMAERLSAAADRLETAIDTLIAG